jgi:hypothetical protein
MDQKQREEKVAQVKEQIAKLEEVNVESLSDEDLESVSGGCSVWCCTNVANKVAEADGNP